MPEVLETLLNFAILALVYAGGVVKVLVTCALDAFILLGCPPFSLVMLLSVRIADRQVSDGFFSTDRLWTTSVSNFNALLARQFIVRGATVDVSCSEITAILDAIRIWHAPW